jgi:dCTP deaminase
MAQDASTVSFSPPLFPELIMTGSAETYSTGILPSQHIRCLIDAGHLTAPMPFEPDQLQPASIDLRLGAVAYRVRASFLPNRTSVQRRLAEFGFHQLDLTHSAVFERGAVYIVPLVEEVSLPELHWAKANPKSSTGRLDILTRLFTDYGKQFDYVPEGYKGKLYLEIAPQTFSIMVSQFTRLSQLRFWRGKPLPSDTAIAQLHENEGVVYAEEDERADALISKGLWIHVELGRADESGIVGYRAKRHSPIVDLSKMNYYAPEDFWDPIVANDRRFVILDPDEFYILGSQERIRIPPGYAAEMVGYEPKLGEFRVHYAGFFDPGFGYATPDLRGTPAVLEVRSLGVPYVLEDGQQVARLIFERLQSTPDRLYGPEIGSSYQSQGLSLSKQFRSR